MLGLNLMNISGTNEDSAVQAGSRQAQQDHGGSY